MNATNRFLERASCYLHSEIDLVRVFEGSTSFEMDDVLDALEEVGARRLSAGSPIRVSELAEGLEHLMHDELILDVGIDICLRGLTTSGMNEAEARAHLLNELTASMSGTDASSLLQSHIEVSETAKRPYQSGALPAAFGPLHEDGAPRYELRRVIGSGSQGTVFEARDRVFEEDGHASFVAIKILNHRMSPEYGRLEGVRTRRLRHPNLARVYDMGYTEQGQLFITQELVEGVTLNQWVDARSRTLTEREALRLTRDIARGIEHAHANGVVHRDLKPANILVDRTGSPIITDFGVAQTLEARSSDRDIGKFGTLAFRAPEQSKIRSAEGLPLLDLYAVTGILFWLLTGKYPNGDTAEEARRWLEDPDGSGGPGRIKHGLSQDVESVLRRGLSPSPGGRYQSVSAFLHDIENILNHRPIAGAKTPLYRVIRLFVRRQPVVAGLILTAILVLAGSGWLIADSLHREQISRLNQQVLVEQERIAGMKRTGDMMSRMINSWFSAAEVSDDPAQATINMLLMHAMSANDVIVRDPAVAKSFFEKQITHGEAYLASLDPPTTSPFDRAILHELIGTWCLEVDGERARRHLMQARSILESNGVAARDPWCQRLESRLAVLD